MMKRLLLLVAALTGLAWAAPAPASAGGCGKAERLELGASNIVGGEVTYQDNVVVAGTTVGLDPRVTARVDLAAPTCGTIAYHVAVYDDEGLTRLLGSATAAGDGSTSLLLLDDASIDAPSSRTVYVILWTSSSRNPVIDRAPNSGSNSVTDDVPPGQSWH